MNVNRDVLVIKNIKKHYNEMLNELDLINDDFNEFLENTTVNKAIIFDLFQIGELFGNLSDEAKKMFPKTDIKGIVDIRNFIAHGYVIIDNKIIWDTIHTNLKTMMKIFNDNF